MQCLRCGRDLESQAVFCEACHRDMEAYPVKPGTVVLLPQYIQYNQPKRTPVRIVPPEEQIRKLKKRNKILVWIAAVSVAVAAVSIWVAISLFSEYDGKFLPGQNYSTVGSKTETESSTAPSFAEQEN